MWYLGTWFSGGLGSVSLMLGLDDLKGFFQPKLFYDSMGGHLQFQVLLLLGKQQQMYNNSSDVYEDIYH